MKAPSGFGKRYFTHSAILAYSVFPVMSALETSARYYFSTHPIDLEAEEEEPPPEEFLQTLLSLLGKPCHCNQFFQHKTRLLLLFCHFIPRCPYYTTHYAFRRSGVHPPYLSF
ncbi:MAG TPA: hypothetical protein ENK82_05205 [Campylobacterales bacterium]|nr:hypothetical protein [Campylobacterales bacterium]